MPNRILKESICTSDSVDALSWFEEVLFYRLIVNCDDFGRFDGRTAVIKNRLFPLKDNITVKAVDAALQKLASVELVVLYEFEGKPYLHLPSWGEHQTLRAKKSKYPAPECGVKSSEIICKQMQADVHVNQSNPKKNPNPNPNPIKAPAAASALDVAMADFADMRKKIKKPLTEKARELTLSELEKLAPGDEAKKVAILEQSILHCWQGVFPLKGNPAVKNGMKCSYPTASATVGNNVDDSDLKWMLKELKVEDDLDRLERQYGGVE